MGNYFLQYAASARSTCKGACKEKIPKGELRLGTEIELGEHTGYSWKDIRCLTPRVISTIKKSIGETTDLPGFESLKPEDQEIIIQIFVTGKVAPGTAFVKGSKRPVKAESSAEEEEEKPKKKKVKAAAKEKKVVAKKKVNKGSEEEAEFTDQEVRKNKKQKAESD